MGFFSPAKTKENIVGHCFICNTSIIETLNANTGATIEKAKYLLSDNSYICPVCANQKGISTKKIITKSKTDILTVIKSNELSTPEEFSPSKRIIQLLCRSGDTGTFTGCWSYFEIDEEKQLINFPSFEFSFLGKNKYYERIHPISDLIDFELLDNGTKVVDGGSMLGAAIGGLTFGGAGAIVGAGLNNKKIKDECTNLSIKLVFNDINNSTEYIDIIGNSSSITKVKRDSQAFSELYLRAQDCLSIFTILLRKNDKNLHGDTQKSSISNPDILDTIKKLNDLKELGLLTVEEFESKKAELLLRL